MAAFWAIYWRYKPTPESSDGAGVTDVGTRGCLLARPGSVPFWEMLRGRLVAIAIAGPVRVLPSQAGLVDVDLAVACPSSD